MRDQDFGITSRSPAALRVRVIDGPLTGAPTWRKATVGFGARIKVSAAANSNYIFHRTGATRFHQSMMKHGHFLAYAYLRCLQSDPMASIGGD